MCADHGGPLSECADDERVWYPRRHICYASMELAAADRRYRALHEEMSYHNGTFDDWAKKASKSHPYHFMDGVRLYVSETEDTSEDFLSPQRAEHEGGDDGHQA